MAVRHVLSILTVAALALLVPARPAVGEQAARAGILPVAVAEQVGPAEVRITVTLYNAGEKPGRDYAAFLHFDRSAGGETLLNLPAPGPRPMVLPTGSSTWGPSETTPLVFPAVTMPKSLRQEVFVKAGLYDAAGSGGRFPLAGADETNRVLVGRLVPQGEGWVFQRAAPGAPGAGGEAIGVRPRAMVKPMPEEPAVRLGEADPAGWVVEGVAGGTVESGRTREQLCWSESSLKLTYAGESAESGFLLRPKQPLPVPESARAAHLWVFSSVPAWNEERTPEDPLLRCRLEFRDGKGDTRVLSFRNALGHLYWYVARARIPEEWPRPLVLTGVRFSGCTNRRPLSIYLDALVFAREEAPEKLTTTARLDQLPFPTTPDGPLPPAPAGPCTNNVERAGESYRLTCAAPDGKLTYTYTPRTGAMDDIAVEWAPAAAGSAVTRFRPAVDGGPTVEVGGRSYGPAAPAGSRECLGVAVEPGGVRARWRWRTPGGAVEYSLALSIKGKSLLVDVDAPGGEMTGFSPGVFSGPASSRFIPFPYWSYGIWDWGRDGGVVLADGLFVSGFPDLYRSQASELAFGVTVSHRPEALRAEALSYCPGVRYRTRSDGRRNPLRERFLFTVSRGVHEVLPGIPHPPSPNREKLAPFVHSTGGQASRLASQLDEWQRLAAYGVNRVYIRHFDGMWADAPQGPQEWTLTEHAAPVAGDTAVRRYLDELRRLGFLPVLYTNYTDLQPVAEAFNWDRVARRPDGDISDACWPGSYPLKPLRAVELQAHYAPRVAERFGTEGSFCDVHTAVGPWHKVDFDARLPGAAQLGTTYRAYAALLLNERKAYGAVYSEGSRHWLYAGLHDGSDAQIASPAPHREPFLVDFDLLRIHPKEMDAGMSWISRYVKDRDAVEELGGWEAAVDRFNAATIAFGHQGTFTRMSFRGYPADVRTYSLIQPLQVRYAMRPAARIAYHDPATGKLLETSDAIRAGAYRESQVHVRYEGGLEVWVNGSLKTPWKVSAGGADYTLPPSGFVGTAPDGALVYSATVGEGRVDYARDGNTRFIDARGQRQRVEGIETDGAAILKKGAKGAWSVWPLGQITRLALSRPALLPQGPLACILFDEAGKELRRLALPPAGEWVELPLGEEAFRLDVAGE